LSRCLIRPSAFHGLLEQRSSQPLMLMTNSQTHPPKCRRNNSPRRYPSRNAPRTKEAALAKQRFHIRDINPLNCDALSFMILQQLTCANRDKKHRSSNPVFRKACWNAPKGSEIVRREADVRQPSSVNCSLNWLWYYLQIVNTHGKNDSIKSIQRDKSQNE
jgi:hypothetical protein